MTVPEMALTHSPISCLHHMLVSTIPPDEGIRVRRPTLRQCSQMSYRCFIRRRGSPGKSQHAASDPAPPWISLRIDRDALLTIPGILELIDRKFAPLAFTL